MGKKRTFKSDKNTDDTLFAQVWENRTSGQKFICVPKSHKIGNMDFVKVVKLKVQFTEPKESEGLE